MFDDLKKSAQARKETEQKIKEEKERRDKDKRTKEQQRKDAIAEQVEKAQIKTDIKQAQAKAQDQAKAQNKAADLKQLRPAQFAKALKRANDLKSKSDPEKTEAGFGMF